jgi:hypothetical protein
LVIQKAGEGRLYYRVGLRYAARTLLMEPYMNGFEVSRNYSPVRSSSFKQDENTYTIKRGDLIKVTIEFVRTMLFNVIRILIIR